MTSALFAYLRNSLVPTMSKTLLLLTEYQLAEKHFALNVSTESSKSHYHQQKIQSQQQNPGQSE